MRLKSVHFREVEKLLILLFVAMFININNNICAQTPVSDRNINTLEVFKEDPAKKTLLPHKLQPARSGVDIFI